MLGGDPDGDGGVDMQNGDGCDASDDKSMPAPAMTTTSYAIHAPIRKKVVFARWLTPIAGLSEKTQ